MPDGAEGGWANPKLENGWTKLDDGSVVVGGWHPALPYLPPSTAVYLIPPGYRPKSRELDNCVVLKDSDFLLWTTPDGVIEARAYEIYIGLRGQARIGLVDHQGRVWHYDAILVGDPQSP